MSHCLRKRRLSLVSYEWSLSSLFLDGTRVYSLFRCRTHINYTLARCCIALTTRLRSRFTLQNALHFLIYLTVRPASSSARCHWTWLACRLTYVRTILAIYHCHYFSLCWKPLCVIEETHKLIALRWLFCWRKLQFIYEEWEWGTHASTRMREEFCNWWNCIFYARVAALERCWLIGRDCSLEFDRSADVFVIRSFIKRE